MYIDRNHSALVLCMFQLFLFIEHTQLTLAVFVLSTVGASQQDDLRSLGHVR